MQLYENSGYRTLKENNIIILDINSGGDSTAQPHDNTKDFDITLQENLILSEEYELYIESITTFNSVINTSTNNSAFLLKINDLNLNNGFNTDNSNIESNKIIIPNLSTVVEKTYRHKGKKINFICSLNPIKINNISGRLTNLNGETMSNANTSRCFIELIFIPKYKNKIKKVLDKMLYENTKYFYLNNNRNVILDLNANTSNNAPFITTFNKTLQEPLIIDRTSEVYLDSCIIYKSKDNFSDNIGDDIGFLLNIDEFNINNGYTTSNNNLKNKIIIPNEFNSNNEFIETFNGAAGSNSVNLSGLNEELFTLGITGDIVDSNGVKQMPDDGSIVASGSGEGLSGSFDSTSTGHDGLTTNNYFLLHGTGTGTGTLREICTKDITDLFAKEITTISLSIIVGDDNNGGENPDSGEDLMLRIKNSLGVSVGTIKVFDHAHAHDSDWFTLEITPADEITHNLSATNSYTISWTTSAWDAADPFFPTNLSYIEIYQNKVSHKLSDHYGLRNIKIKTNDTLEYKPTKSKKYNYISTIEPKIINTLSGTLTNLNNTTIVEDNTGRVVFNFLIKPSL